MEIVIYIIVGLAVSGLFTANLLKTIWDIDYKKMKENKKELKPNYKKFLENRQLKKQAKKENED